MRFMPLALIVAAPVAGAVLALKLAPPGEGSPTVELPVRAEADGGAKGLEAPEALGDARDYVRVGRQIIIPIIKDGETTDLMMFDLALDIPAAEADRARLHEPRIRDAFLDVLLRLANTGAFGETYTDRRVLEQVREELRAAARRHLGPSVRDVLILDVIRQAV